MKSDRPGASDEIVMYLLGTLDDNEERERVERQIMTDDVFAERVDVVEHELIEKYLDGELSHDQTRRFESGFLATPEGRRRLSLTENLRTYSAGARRVVPHAKRSWFDRNATPLTQWLRFAFGAALVLAVTFGIWQFAFPESNTEKALAEMREAYKGQRIAQARLSVFSEHTPYSRTRGPRADAVDPAARDRAQSFLSDATRGTPETGSNHALGVLYLAQGNLERAEQELKAAVAAAPQDAKVHTDLGALYLEKSGSPADGDPIETLDRSLKHLDIAIALDPSLPEPRFNKALVLEAMKIPNQARVAWEDYLKIDPNSKWSVEARAHLQAIDEISAELSAAELETKFLEAMRLGDTAAASELIGNNRELIREKYLPQRLAMSYVGSPPERRKEILAAMRLAGELEMKRGDPFAKEIAFFYSKLDSKTLAAIVEANSELLLGYQKCLVDAAFRDSIPHFLRAQAKYTQAGDRWNAALSRYFVAYALINDEKVDEALIELDGVRNFTRDGNYVWLEATTAYWLGAANTKAGNHSRARKHHEHALVLAEKFGDSYSIQRNLGELARINFTIGRRAAGLTYIRRVLDENARPGNSGRQNYRNMCYVAEVLPTLGLLNAARYASLSCGTAAQSTGSTFFAAMALARAGDISSQLEENDTAPGLIAKGMETALSIKDEKTREKALAFCHLKLADVERRSGLFESARNHYQRAKDYYSTAAMPFFLVQAANGLLLADLKLGNTAAIEKGIEENVLITEKYREQILDVDEKGGFLDQSIGIYEIAAGFEHDRGRPEAAYDYAERSSSRALLDWLRRGTAGEKSVVPRLRPGVPETIDSVRARMPEGSQILQYAVLNDRVLAWVISRSGFTSHHLTVRRHDLVEEIKEYRRMIEHRDYGAESLGRVLYDQLIAPIRNQLDPSKDICIVPSDVLFILPFAALVSPENRAIIADYTITYAPSASVFLHMSQTAEKLGPVNEESVLAVGNPTFERSAFDGLPYLEGAEKEVSAIAELYEKAKPLIGKPASRAAVQDKLPSADIFHFAGHYVVERHSPMSSYLLLSKNGEPESSKFTNAHITALDLSKLRLIVLAACRTGTEGYSPGEGLIGLTRTFLGANVPLVIGSQWNVDSEATADLMFKFHSYRRLGRLQTASALRAAQLELLNDPTGRYSAPYYWSAFAVYGGHAGF